jgi:propanol-preferring alcohol dehydrogenase
MRAQRLIRLADLGRERPPLELAELAEPQPAAGQIRIAVAACGVCHTELDEIEGRTPPPRLPVVPGHQVVGRVSALGAGARRFAPGDRVGVAWIFSACGRCRFCRRGLENLCPDFRATGRDADGGYAEALLVDEAFAHPIPAALSDVQAAPLLCAGAVGYRSLRQAQLENGMTLGLTGFGASGHLVLPLARHLYPDSPVYVFTRSTDACTLARSLGAAWAGSATDTPPGACDAIIDTTPAWAPVVHALGQLRPGGRLVINAIRKEAADRQALLGIDYAAHLWQEKQLVSVANVTRRDVAEFLPLAAAVALRPSVTTYPLEQAGQALLDLKRGIGVGAKVLSLAC